MPLEDWTCLEKKKVFSAKPWLEVEAHTVQLPDGTVIPEWHWVETPPFVNVVAVTADGGFICFEQTKYALEAPGLSITGGYLDGDEKPLTAAKRELQEETGYCSEEWTSLGAFALDGNRGCGKGHLFLAENCSYRGGEVSDDLEQQCLKKLNRREIESALLKGEFGIMPWAGALALALIHLDSATSAV